MFLGTEELARDAMQEVFLRLWRYRSAIDETPVRLRYLYRTSDRVCIELLRRRREQPLEGEGRIFSVNLTTDANVEGPMEVAETLRRFFGSLDEKLRPVAVLHYCDGLTQEQIADELGTSRRTIGKRIAEVRNRAKGLALQIAEVPHE